ncbi:hypothetical protein D7096_07940, partial [Listeria monocytogenes]|nr:hypothetical protein [Listeria monocytogenes]
LIYHTYKNEYKSNKERYLDNKIKEFKLRTAWWVDDNLSTLLKYYICLLIPPICVKSVADFVVL